MLLLILINAVFASTFALGKAGLQFAPPELFIGIRMIIAGICIFLYWLAFGKQQTGSIKKSFWYLAGYALIGITLSYLTEFWALAQPEMTAGKAGLINSFAPFITAIISYIFVKKK